MKLDEFIEKINSLTKQTDSATDLEYFLRSLWKAILKYQDQEPSFELFQQIISESWTGEPIDFDKSWFAIKENANMIEIKTSTRMDDFEYLRGTILYQIADLRRMRDAGYFEMDGNILFMGVQSPTGSSWYNWSPEDFLNAATSALGSSNPKQNVVETITWRDLAALLYLGQLYE